MSESLLRRILERAFRGLSVLSSVWGIGLGSYVIYASLLGGSPFPFVDGPLWAGFGALLILQSLWHLGSGT
jgi:hypothetical protein